MTQKPALFYLVFAPKVPYCTHSPLLLFLQIFISKMTVNIHFKFLFKDVSPSPKIECKLAEIADVLIEDPERKIKDCGK